MNRPEVLSKEVTSVMMPPQQRAEGTNFGLKCLKEQKVPVGVTVVVAALLLAIIALAVKKCPSCPPCAPPAPPSCPRGSVRYALRCFYFVEAEAEWDTSRRFCRALGGRLAAIARAPDLDFLLRHARPLHYWVGLRREGPAAPWRWVDGPFLNSSFPVRGDGRCAYISRDGVGSDLCSRKKSSVCSHPQNGRGGLQETQIRRNFT